MPISFLILSDIHFGQYAISSDLAPSGTVIEQVANAVPIRASLIKTAKNFNPSVLLASGDLTSIASPAEFIGSVAFAQEVAVECGISKKDTFYTLGNHDANWRISKLGDPAEKFSSDSGYNRVATEIGMFYISNLDSKIAGPIPGTGLFQRSDYDLLILNSGYFCTHDQAFPHGKLGKGQLAWAKETLTKWDADGRWKVVMLHHHLFNYPYPTPGPDVSALEEGPELLEAVGKAGVDLVCHGHRHHPKIYTRTENDWHHPVTFFCAGSVGVTEQKRNHGDIPNLFHIISLRGRDNLSTAIGQVDTFKYTVGEGWIRSRRSAAVPLDSPQIFGSCVTEAQRQADAKACIAAVIKALPAQLPAFSNLPISLQCMPWQDLKRLLIDAAKSANCEIFGEYPSDVMVVQKNV